MTWAGGPIFVDESIPEDAVVAQKVAEFAAPLVELKKQVIGQTAVELLGERAVVRNQESNLGNLIADALLWTTANDGAQIAFMNGGGIRATIPAGPVSYGQVLEVLPFGNRVLQLDLSGADVLAALENGFSRMEPDPVESSGRFLQVGGLRLTADLGRPAGTRVTEILVGSADTGFAPLSPSTTYRIVTNDFLANGGDGYSMFLNGRNIREGDTPLDLVVSDYIKAHSPVHPLVQASLTLVGSLAPTQLPATGNSSLSDIALALAALDALSLAAGLVHRSRIASPRR